MPEGSEVREADPLGIVVEGGGCRAIYAAGVLDVFDAAEPLMREVKGVLDVSAGAIHAASFVSRQRGRSLRIYERFAPDERFGSFRRWLRTGCVIDRDFCFREIPDALEPYDHEAFARRTMRFFAGVTNLETGKAEFPELTDMRRDIDLLAASTALPYVMPAVRWQGKALVDGGCADRVPAAAFEAMGFTRQIAVLTRPEGDSVRDRDAWLAPWIYRKYPAFVRAFQKSGEAYDLAQEHLKRREEEGKVFVIRPKAPLGVPRITHDAAEIRRAWEAGRRDAQEAMPRLLEWLGR